MKELFQSIPYTMTDSLQPMNNEYTGLYTGTVLDNDDPEGRGRCKVYVYGVYDDSFNADKGKKLPWSIPCQPLFCGGNGKNGTFQCPDLSATVLVAFSSGDISKPLMLAQITDKKSTKVDKTYQPQISLFTPSSCTMYWDGMYIEMYKPTHTVTVSAENITAFASHDLSGHAEHDAYLDAINNIYVKAGVDLNIKTGANMNIEIGKDVNMKVAGNVTETINGNLSETVNGTTLRKSPTNTIDGKLTVTQETTINAQTTINSSEKVTGDANIGGKSFLGHIHGNGNLGSPTTPPA